VADGTSDGPGTSPEITAASWGRLQTEDGRFKDAKLFPGGAREWDWRETGTSHEPGVGPADVEELLEHGATTVVMGTGFHGRLRVREETLRVLEGRGVVAHVMRTGEAVDLYNRLREAGPVGALLHSTC
jgi:hypothetical protein